MRSVPSSTLTLLTLLLASVLVTACGITAETLPADTQGEGPALEYDETDEDDEVQISPGADPQEPAPETTETEWGTIWDRLPADFPLFPGAIPADEAAPADVVSGAFTVEDVGPDEVVEWMQAALEESTYSTEALSGPFDDGSYVIDSVGEGDCRMQVAIAPSGAGTTLAVRYGADCPP